MSLRWLQAALPILLVACAHQPQLLERPDRVWAAPRGLDATAACVIRALDEHGRSGSSLAPSMTHAKRVIEPGKVYEIRPKQRSAVTAETYLIRLEKSGEQITRMSAYIKSPWNRNVIKALSPCGTRS